MIIAGGFFRNNADKTITSIIQRLHRFYRNHTLTFMPTENPGRGDMIIAGGVSHRIGNQMSLDFGGIVAFFFATMLTKSSFEIGIQLSLTNAFWESPTHLYLYKVVRCNPLSPFSLWDI